MNNEQFCYWLQGFVETANPESITTEQWKLIVKNLPKQDSGLTAQLVYPPNVRTPKETAYCSSFGKFDVAPGLSFSDTPITC